MCFVKPLKIKNVNKTTVLLENGIKAYYNKDTKKLKPNDLVLVFGNLVIEKIAQKSKCKDQILDQNLKTIYDL